MNDCIPLNELKALLAANSAIVIDVRSDEEYEERHIPGALHYSGAALEAAAENFDKKNLYVTACGKGGGRSAAAAAQLLKMGFNAKALCGGTFGWFEH